MPWSSHLRPFLAVDLSGLPLSEDEISCDKGTGALPALRARLEVRPPGPPLAVSTLELGVAGRELSGVTIGVASVDVVSPSYCFVGATVYVNVDSSKWSSSRPPTFAHAGNRGLQEFVLRA